MINNKKIYPEMQTKSLTREPLIYAITAKNFVIIAKFLLFEKIYIAKMQRYLWHADYADTADSRGFFIIYFLIRDNSWTFFDCPKDSFGAALGCVMDLIECFYKWYLNIGIYLLFARRTPLEDFEI